MFQKALGIDPDFADAQKNKESVSGQLQVVQIIGTITPTVTISRIGTFYTTATPVPMQTEITTPVPVVTAEIKSEITAVTTTPIQKKTTYSPVSPLTALGALIVIGGAALVLKRE